MRKRANPRKIVFKAMGVEGKGTIAELSRRDIQRHFKPYTHRQYPTKMTSDASRVPMEFGARQWGHIDFMKNALKSPALARQIAKDPLARIEFERALFDALQERALKAYAEEWASLSPKTISTLIGRAKKQSRGSKRFWKSFGVKERPTPAIANENNANMVAHEAMLKLKKGKPVTIADLGCGGGETIVPIINSIPKEFRKNVRVVLVDVMATGLKSTRQRLVRRGLNGKGQVISIKENISRLMQNDRVAQLFGNADIVTSGAALHHVASIDPTFEGVKRLLKKGGSFIFWDWGHAAWRAPRLVIAPTGARVDKFGRYYEKGTRTRYAEKQTAFVSRSKVGGVRGKAPKEIQTVKDMLSTWISLLHFPEKRKAEFLEWFDRKAARGEPIEFSDYLKRLEGARLEKGMTKSEIRYWEGHRPPELYHDAMKRVGLIGEKERPFTIYPTASSLLYQMKVRKE